MSCLGLYLTLLYAASFLLNSASSIEGVSLKCNETVTVVAGELETLNCTVTYSEIENPNNCKCEHCYWNDINNRIPCNCGGLIQYGLDYASYVSINISNVTTNGNYSVIIRTDCGWATSSPIEVIQLGDGGRMDRSNSTHIDETRPTHVPAIFCGISIIFIVLGILYFLFRTNRGRQIMNSMDTAPGSQGPLIA